MRRIAALAVAGLFAAGLSGCTYHGGCDHSDYTGDSRDDCSGGVGTCTGGTCADGSTDGGTTGAPHSVR